ncbi:MAG: hypothetical protein WBD40_17125 [Tepidisphaeraceae bacterium]
MTKEIYVALLDEGVDVWRPAPAWKVDDSTYIVLRPDDYDPDDEKWEFPPGSTVICEPKAITDGRILAAVRRKQIDRQSA